VACGRAYAHDERAELRVVGRVIKILVLIIVFFVGGQNSVQFIAFDPEGELLGGFS
jgi:hypothetical protein